jgi:hypothetical protein
MILIQHNLKIIGKMKLSSLFISFMFVFIGFNCISQVEPTQYPVVEVINGDTVITFTFAQGKKLAILNEERKRLEELNKIITSQSNKKDTIIEHQVEQLRLYAKVKEDYEVIISEKDAIQQTCNDEKKILQDEIGKKNRHKWFAIIGGVVGTGIMTYFYATK